MSLARIQTEDFPRDYPVALTGTLKETIHRNLRKIYKMQVKSCRNIFRVLQKQDNFSTELEPKGGVMSQTLFRPISTNTGSFLMI